jgi:hypothetical protein
VTAFDLDHHRDFTGSTRATDPRRIKFSHARHLANGLTLEAGGAWFTFADLKPADRVRYGWTPTQALATAVQLQCNSCHRLDGDESLAGLAGTAASPAPPRTAGAYMLPVAYANHCSACHTLAFDPKIPDRQVEHGRSPRAVVAELQTFYSAEAVKQNPALLRRTVTSAPVPGPPARKDERIEDLIANKVLTAAKILFGAGVDEVVRKEEHLPIGRRGCLECHNPKPQNLPLVSIASIASLEIEPVLMTPLWFEHALFNHTAHGALGCAACHGGASASKENGPGLLPGIATCVLCHSPARSEQGAIHGGASTACTECHRYHNGDSPRQGAGASARRGSTERSIERFLRGIPPAGEQ